MLAFLLLLLVLLGTSHAQQPCAAEVSSGRIELRGAEITFGLGRHTLRSESDAALSAIACVMAQRPLIHVRIEVHSDSQGNAQASRDLTARRAREVREALVKRGVDGRRIRAYGYGPDKPVPALLVANSRAAKRVEVVLIDSLMTGSSDPDGDGIINRNDACPFEPENFNGYQDEDGCPDTPPSSSSVAKAGPKPAPKPDPKPATPRTSPEPRPAPRPAPQAARTAPALPSIESPARTGRKAKGESAVVIGIEKYYVIPDVPHAKRDASAFYDFLVYTRGVPGGRVQLLTEGSREHILAAVDRAASEAGRGGRVWIYFAGHGIGDPATQERLLLGDDVRPDAIAFSSRGVPIPEIERRVTSAGAEPLLVLDTCYAGVSRGGESLVGGTRFVVPSYALENPERGAQWAAAGPSQLSGPLPEVEHGAFTYFAVGALRGWADGEIDGVRDGKVTAAEANAFVYKALRRMGMLQQQPVWMGDEDLVLSEGVSEKPPF